MTPELKHAPSLEIAYVVFMDLVGYSRLPMEEQTRLMEELQELVRGTYEYQRAAGAGNLLSLPTGDGVALVFFGDPLTSVRCAVEVGRALRHRPELQLRIGIHSGPVRRVEDIRANRNVIGGGINIAQRVMDCGDAGHILVSRTVAEVLTQLSEWSGALHELGECEVKHGERVHLFNLSADDYGNHELPVKLAILRRQRAAYRAGYIRAASVFGIVILAFACLVLIAGSLWQRSEAQQRSIVRFIREFSSDPSGRVYVGPAGVETVHRLFDGWPDSQEATRVKQNCLHMLAALQYGQGNLHEALVTCNELLQASKRLHGDPHGASNQQSLAAYYLTRGQILEELKRPSEALADYRKSQSIAEPARKLGSEQAATVLWYSSLHQAELLRRLGDLDNALESCDTGVKLIREMETRPAGLEVARFHKIRGDVLRDRGEQRREMEMASEARKCWRAALSSYQEAKRTFENWAGSFGIKQDQGFYLAITSAIADCYLKVRGRPASHGGGESSTDSSRSGVGAVRTP
jgi:class 3 adenylate cyclase